MTHDHHIAAARQSLIAARNEIQHELRAYPTPVSGCDAQFNHLIGLRSAISAALQALEAPRFVATPRTPEPTAGVESR